DGGNRPGPGLRYFGAKAMASSTKGTSSRQRRPQARHVRLCLKPAGTSPGGVRITVGKEAADYFVAPIPADFGRRFVGEEIGQEGRYAVNLDGGKRTCECRGHLAHGHCKHADGLAALVAAGRL